MTPVYYIDFSIEDIRKNIGADALFYQAEIRGDGEWWLLIMINVFGFRNFSIFGFC
jgi:hypothetical protein